MSAGCRALTDEEMDGVRKYFSERIGDPEKDKYDLETRNKTIFFLQGNLGFRISELLSLNIKDVLNPNDVVLEHIYLKRKNTKGKNSGRSGYLNEKARELLAEYFHHYYFSKGLKPILDNPLFISRKGVRLCSRQCMMFYRAMFLELGYDLPITGTHILRKCFAKKVYESVDNNIVDLKQAMGHASLSSTEKYIKFDNERVNTALKNLSI